MAGDQQPAAVHVLVHQINELLQNIGKTVQYIESIEACPENQLAGFKQLVADMNAGKVELLFILGGNPVYYSPPISSSRKLSTRFDFEYMSANMWMKLQLDVTGTFLWRTSLRPGVMHAATTAPRPFFSH